MKLSIPELSLVLLVGTSGCGKSSFGRRHFKPTEVVSSDFCRGLVADDENDQSASSDAFTVLHCIIDRRLAAGRLAVVDATNVQPEDRQALLSVARQNNVLTVAIVLNISESICIERNQQRPDRDFGAHVIRRQKKALMRSLRGMKREGFSKVYILDSPEEIEQVEIERTPLWNNRKHDHGPFDLIGDIHGCYDELLELLARLGYKVNESSPSNYEIQHPEGRRIIFLGDLVDRGPKTPQVLKLVMSMVENGSALCVAGNHDIKLMRKLAGKNVSITHGLAESLEQLESEPDEFKQACHKFIDGLISHYVLDDGKLVVAHAGLKEKLQGRSSARVRDFCLYGETTGETDDYGLPVRYNWAGDYRGKAMVVYGHTPVPNTEWINNTICLDTGCVFGGKLTALRYPEKELLSVPAKQMYYKPAKPLDQIDDHAARQIRDDECLDINDVCGKRIVNTRLQKSMTIRAENASAALEVMSRFAIHPNWLVYLPPTMSPSATSKHEDYLEYPDEALKYFSDNGINQIICEEKHMGSRAVVIVCKDEEAVQKRFGLKDQGLGVCYTRTGRPFFQNRELEQALIDRVRHGANESGFWDEHKTDWLVLDCELMPWSMKAQELLRKQYASTGAAASAAIGELDELLAKASTRGLDVSTIESAFSQRKDQVRKYVDAYRRYCWNVDSLKDIKLAPFHILASENSAHVDKSHLWHIGEISKIVRAEGEENLMLTNNRVVDLSSSDEWLGACKWWEQLTNSGSEGMVIKPLDFVATGHKGFVQPAIKCRGKEYLRIIYGPEYDSPAYLERLRQRGLSHKRSLAWREFALGVESLERFVAREPLYRVHECVFAVLALESEPVDPRL